MCPTEAPTAEPPNRFIVDEGLMGITRSPDPAGSHLKGLCPRDGREPRTVLTSCCAHQYYGAIIHGSWESCRRSNRRPSFVFVPASAGIRRLCQQPSIAGCCQPRGGNACSKSWGSEPESGRGIKNDRSKQADSTISREFGKALDRLGRGSHPSPVHRGPN